MALFAKKPAPPEASVTLALFQAQAAVREQHTPVGMLPAEWFPQSGVQLTWPHAGTDWAPMLAEVTACYLRMAYEIASRETLLIVTPSIAETSRTLTEQLPSSVLRNVVLVECSTDDTWARDHAFLTRMGAEGPELLDFRFDGWGGKFEARQDNAINAHLLRSGRVKGKYIDCLDFTLEGGSIESDGRGTILTTAQCLLNPNRNGGLTQEQVEQRLRRDLGAERFLWLHHGHLAGDDTDAHVDTLARLASADTIVYQGCDDLADEHYEPLRAMEEELQSFVTAEGQPYRLLKLPLPAPICDEAGERLPATYANFLILNKAVLYPTYGQPDADEQAAQVLRRAFERYDVVGIDCRALIRQHGSLHCSTMQYPRGVLQSL